MDKCIFPLQTDNICIGTDSNFCTIIYDSNEKDNPGDVIMLANSENTFIVTYNEISHQNETSSEDFTKRDSTQMNNRQSESFRKKFFSYQGRLNRKPYFFRVFSLSIVSSILLEIFLPMVVSCYMNGVRRLHDLNKSGSNRYGSDPLERR